ncbi:hypothetical protein C8F04DRAFT_1405987 [Mycena alexandri]|uniref:Uncharacterized protein n=1 Tax=Mycena alexandri TaxID=1745969 RepID=A0AAD6RXZ4_9AGAR|nr:hypothetical protein C8F04DRAFT_1405987 [Mycena alexandri]
MCMSPGVVGGGGGGLSSCRRIWRYVGRRRLVRQRRTGIACDVSFSFSFLFILIDLMLTIH